jgi:hypothetical protein
VTDPVIDSLRTEVDACVAAATAWQAFRERAAKGDLSGWHKVERLMRVAWAAHRAALKAQQDAADQLADRYEQPSFL